MQTIVNISSDVFLELLRENDGKWIHSDQKIEVYEEVFFDRQWEGRSILLKNIVFKDQVDFGYAKFHTITIQECIFEEGVLFSNAEIATLSISVPPSPNQGLFKFYYS